MTINLTDINLGNNTFIGQRSEPERGKPQHLPGRKLWRRGEGSLRTSGGPIKLEMEFYRADYTDQLDLIPGVTRTGGRTVEFTHDDFAVVYKLMRALLALSST